VAWNVESIAGLSFTAVSRVRSSPLAVTIALVAASLPATERKMPAIDPDDLPKKKITHEMGQDLSLLSVGELAERVRLLKEEVTRLEAEMARKRASQTAADAFFKK
jgi:uncharacterized small protein (DUF1192 family)